MTVQYVFLIHIILNKLCFLIYPFFPVDSTGMWVLTPQKKHTSPLRILASRGYQDCVKHLLLHGAEVDAMVGGKAALHDSCANHRAECTRLLLTYGANPNILSEDGVAPLHLCTTQETLPYVREMGRVSIMA